VTSPLITKPLSAARCWRTQWREGERGLLAGLATGVVVRADRPRATKLLVGWVNVTVDELGTRLRAVELADPPGELLQQPVAAGAAGFQFFTSCDAFRRYVLAECLATVDAAA
jgi:hypothetical protein